MLDLLKLRRTTLIEKMKNFLFQEMKVVLKIKFLFNKIF